MQPEIARRMKPLADRFVETLGKLVEKQVDATIRRIEHEIGDAMASAIAKLDAPPPSVPMPEDLSRARRPKKKLAAKSAVPPPTRPRKSDPKSAGKIICSRCGHVGGNARGCGKPTGHETRTSSAKPKSKMSSDDSEDEPRARHRRSRGVQLPEEPRVIPHRALVAMLHADRVNNAVGDVGGYVVRADREPTLIGHTDEKREVCPVHGWVGRFAFKRDQHVLCLDLESPRCRRCDGRMVVIGDFCDRCGGTGIEPSAIDNKPPKLPAADRPIAVPGFELIPADGSRNSLRAAPRAYTIAVKDLTRSALAAGAAEVEAAGPPVDEPRPLTRGECKDAARPCGYVTCRAHLYLDVDPETGSIKLNFPDVEPWEMTESCSLDIADRGEHLLEDVANLMNITRERTRQIETKAKFNLIAACRELG